MTPYEQERARFDKMLDIQDFVIYKQFDDFWLQKREGQYLVGTNFLPPTTWDTLEEALLDLVRSAGCSTEKIA